MRMRRRDDGMSLDAAQAAAADTGVKGMIPMRRPFLEYVLSALADAGLTDVALVLGPEHDTVRQHFTHEAPPRRLRMHFAVQQEPIGTANAVLAAADTVGEVPFLVLNADNYYPVEALRALASANTACTIAFDRDALIAMGNISADRVRAFAVLDVTADGRLHGIIEKPGDRLDLGSPAAKWVGMNCWAISSGVISACRRVPRSARGEYELPEAVALAIRDGETVRAISMSAPVFDLSCRADIAVVAAYLASVDPRP